MTLSATTFVNYSDPKVTAAFLNNLQTYLLNHHLEHASTGTDPVAGSTAGSTAIGAHVGTHSSTGTDPLTPALLVHHSSNHASSGPDAITFFASTAHVNTHSSSGTDPLTAALLPHHVGNHSSTGDDPLTAAYLPAHASKHNLGGTDALTLKFFEYVSIPAKDWVSFSPRSEGGTGCIYETSQSTNGPERVQLVFGSTLTSAYSTIGAENAYARVALAKDWDGGLVTAQMVTETTNTSTTRTISFKLYGARQTDGSTSNVALSSVIATINDTNMGAGLENHGAESSGFSIGGTGYDVKLRITCNSSDATSTTLIKVHQVQLKYIRTSVVTT